MNITFATITGRSDDLLISVPRAIGVWVRDYNEKTETSQVDIFLLCLRAVEAEQHPQGIQTRAGERAGNERMVLKKTKHKQTQKTENKLALCHKRELKSPHL